MTSDLFLIHLVCVCVCAVRDSGLCYPFFSSGSHAALEGWAKGPQR